MKKYGFFILSIIFLFQSVIAQQNAQGPVYGSEIFDTQLQVFKTIVESQATIKRLKQEAARFARLNKLRKQVVDSQQGKKIITDQILKIWKSVQEQLNPLFTSINFLIPSIKKDDISIDIAHEGIDAVNKRGETALFLLVKFSIEAGSKKDQLIKLLLDNDANVDKGNVILNTSPLMEAAATEPFAAKLLLESGANPNKQDNDGNTALIYAVNFQAMQKDINVLLASGADVSIENKKGQTALDIARIKARESRGSQADYYYFIVKTLEYKTTGVEFFDAQLEIFKKLIESETLMSQLKKDVAAFRATNKLRRQVVNSSQGIKIVNDQLLKWQHIQEELNPFFENYVPQSEFVDVEHNGVDAVNWDKYTALYVLVRYSIEEFRYADTKESLRLINLLLDNGADINKGGGDFNWSPLSKAARNQIEIGKFDTDVMALLIRRGANVNYQDDFRETALMEAAGWCNLEGVKLLLKHGADVWKKNSLNLTALDIAEIKPASNKKDQVIEALKAAQEAQKEVSNKN